MNDESKRALGMDPDQWRRALPWLVAAMVVLAGWLLVGGVRQLLVESRTASVH